MTLRRIIAGIKWGVAHGGRFISMSDPVVSVSPALGWARYGNAVPLDVGTCLVRAVPPWLVIKWALRMEI